MDFPHPHHSSVKRRVGITVAGGVLVLAGIVMLVTPGPGWVTIAAGVGVWSKEYAWAKRLLDHMKQRIADLRKKV